MFAGLKQFLDSDFGDGFFRGAMAVWWFFVVLITIDDTELLFYERIIGIVIVTVFVALPYLIDWQQGNSVREYW